MLWGLSFFFPVHRLYILKKNCSTSSLNRKKKKKKEGKKNSLLFYLLFYLNIPKEQKFCVCISFSFFPPSKIKK
jgi:hypothetical protein